MAAVTKKLKEIKQEELSIISKKRSALHPEDGIDRPQENLFGIALSGGGIRSATLSLGFLKILNECGILSRADYLSTVSGGGYAGAYVQAKLCEAGSYKELFSLSDIENLRLKGYYLAPGRGIMRMLTRLRLAGAFAASVVMNWVWVILLFLLLALSFKLIAELVSAIDYDSWLNYGFIICGVVLAFHYFFHSFRRLLLWHSDILNAIEGGLLAFVVIVAGLSWGRQWVPGFFETWSICFWGTNLFSGLSHGWLTCIHLLLVAVVFAFSGLFANPNLLTLHRFYRDRLSGAFLRTVSRKSTRIRLRKWIGEKDGQCNPQSPYPLINTCLNVLGKGKHIGAKTSDYFLLSPLYCGSELTDYISTAKSYFYSRMSFATATAISGAAVNPEMGQRTNKVVAFFMTLFNLQLGYWTRNPKARSEFPFDWWPYYYILQLLSKTHAERRRVNISDGGHIENLGVFELLRRESKLIIAVDAGADPTYGFSDLRNLVVRARNDLGVVIKFRDGCQPEDCIKPKPSIGFSSSQFAIADVSYLPEKQKRTPYNGLLVYVKSSMKAPSEFRDVAETDPEYKSFYYKMYHPRFPHESTADQFFDTAQWEAYFRLGQYIAGDLLDVKLRDRDQSRQAEEQWKKMTINELKDRFDAKKA
ncbi:MAG: patatin-like phospholipase family protein [Ignavibacteriales bacterium]|nr:patatin-like phospholipase family protein [Ignavibacteriales bacterium]